MERFPKEPENTLKNLKVQRAADTRLTNEMESLVLMDWRKLSKNIIVKVEVLKTTGRKRFIFCSAALKPKKIPASARLMHF